MRAAGILARALAGRHRIGHPMPRAASAALLIVAAHALCLATLGRTPPGPLLSNLSMVGASLLAAATCWRAAARSDGFSRSVWRLVAVSLGVWSAAQTSWTVTENVLQAAIPEPSLTHLLFRLCGAPLIVALLLDEDRVDVVPPDWARVLDFAQVGIVFLFFYFDVYFVPPAPGMSLASLQVAGFLDISDIENWLIVVAYVLRAALARTPEAHRLFWRTALYVVAYAITSTTYNYGYYHQLSRTGQWFDWPWTMALGVATAVAAGWQPRVEAARSTPASAIRVLTVGWVPAVAPIAVLALALQVARYQLALAFIAVLSSVSVFGARLLVERYRQVRALEALRASEERYARLIELTPDAIAVFADGHIHFANPAAAQLAGAAGPQELVGRAVADFVSPETRLAMRDRIAAFPTGSPPVELEARRLDGSALNVEVVFLPLGPPDTAGTAQEIPAGLVVARDVTERRRAETERETLIRELETRNAELERFSYSVSHDLKAPLVTIRGFLGLVEQAAERGDIATLHADMQRIHRASDRMERLLNELLDLSRAGHVAGPAVPVELESVAREAVANAAQELKLHRVSVDIAPGLPVVMGDRVRLLEVLQNLIANAARFMGDEARPRVMIGRRGGAPEGQALIFVQDNGIGIDSRYHEQVFRLFDKLDPASPGTGVGLALVKRIVEVHGGRVWVESPGAGRGTTFCFTLPLAAC
jgi:PAS domain S-box-containing protein